MRKSNANPNVTSLLQKLVEKTAAFYFYDRLNREYSEQACKKNAINYYYRALTYFQLANDKGQFPFENQPILDRAIENAKAGIKSNAHSDMQALGNFLIALAHPDINARIQHLKAIQKLNVAQDSPLNNIAGDFNYFSEAQYLLGLLYKEKKDKLKSLVAFITAGLQGHQQAKDTISGDISFDNSPLGFSFSAELVDTTLRYHVLQSLYANKVIGKYVYLNELQKLVDNPSELHPVPRTLEKIHAQLILISDTQDIPQKLRAAKADHRINQSDKIKSLEKLFDAAQEKFINGQAKQAASKAPRNYGDDFLTPVASWSTLITGWVFGGITALLEVATILPAGMKYMLMAFEDNTKYQTYDASHSNHWMHPHVGKSTSTSLSNGRTDGSWFTYVADTGIAFVGSWIGRAIGFVAGVLAAALTSILAYPIYRAHKAISASGAKRQELYQQKGNVETNAAFLVAAQGSIKASFQEAAERSLSNKGANSHKPQACKGLKLFNPAPSAQPADPVRADAQPQRQ